MQEVGPFSYHYENVMPPLVPLGKTEALPGEQNACLAHRRQNRIRGQRSSISIGRPLRQRHSDLRLGRADVGIGNKTVAADVVTEVTLIDGSSWVYLSFNLSYIGVTNRTIPRHISE